MIVLMWISALSLPALMLLIGLTFKYSPPKEINDFYGYRTKRTKKSQEAWDYGHQKMGVLWIKLGAGLLVAVLIAEILTPAGMELLSLVYMLAGLLVMILSIPVVERDLARKFDKDGERQDGSGK